MSMSNQDEQRFSPSLSDEAVQAKTGKTWSEWFAILDAAGAATMGHPAIARYLSEQHQVPAWWTQMVTVNYEQARGLRARHEKPEGYEVSASKNIAVPVGRLFGAWLDEGQRAQWLPDQELVIRKATEPKSIRITWPDGTSVVANFYEKGDARSQVAVQHGKLPGPEEAETMKRYWREAVERLRQLLES
jgi:uncharacterized protein YndB with AHSA1/START domain